MHGPINIKIINIILKFRQEAYSILFGGCPTPVVFLVIDTFLKIRQTQQRRQDETGSIILADSAIMRPLSQTWKRSPLLMFLVSAWWWLYLPKHVACFILSYILCMVSTNMFQYVDSEINTRKEIVLIQSVPNYVFLILVYRYILFLFMVASSHILKRRFEQTLVVGVTLNCCHCWENKYIGLPNKLGIQIKWPIAYQLLGLQKLWGKCPTSSVFTWPWIWHI